MKRIPLSDISVERISSGGWLVAAMAGGYRVARRYFGITRRAAVAAFRDEVKP